MLTEDTFAQDKLGIESTMSFYYHIYRVKKQLGSNEDTSVPAR